MRRMYSKNQLENQTEELLAFGNLPSIKADEIIENMSGYSFATSTKENATIEYVYAGVVKTGNKITFVWAVNITRTGAIGDGELPIGTFSIPSSIGAKLFPTISNWLKFENLYCASDYYAGISNPALIVKPSNTSIFAELTDINNHFIIGTKYYCRLEATFLLSENLAE